MIPRWRSLLFAAADDQRRLTKISERGADAVILDLEDAVPVDRKAAAREGLAASVAGLSYMPVLVRINGGWLDTIADLSVAVRPGVAAIVVPKLESAARLIVIREMMAEYAASARMERIPDIVALIESPAGIAQLDAIAAVDGVIGLALGSEDFSLALGVAPTPEALELPCRLLALTASTRGQMALGLPISIATIEDMEAWTLAVNRARAFGINGALCIHPAQIAPVNVAFTPSAAERDAAIRVIAAWEAAKGAGVVLVDGRMVDRPVVLAAQHILSISTT